MIKICDNCEYLCRREGEGFCHIVNSGIETKIEDTEEDRCPKWERKSLYGRGNQNKPRKKPVEDFITYEIMR